MKNKFLLIIILFIVILAIAVYGIYLYRSKTIESQKINNEYKSYYNVQIIGNELLSIINKTQDIDEQYGIQKDQEGMYIENATNSIKIYVKFKYKDDYRVLEMEKIINGGIENFAKAYSTADFVCTEINYHEKTNNVKALTFTEVE